MTRILVVDDEPTVRSLIRDVLEGEGYEVAVAEDGFAAVAYLQAANAQTLPDCMVLDVMMPGMDGYAVLQRIRSSPATESLPVVMLTALSDDEQAWKAWTKGVDYFLGKPFEADELVRYLDYLFTGEGESAAAM